MVAAKDVAADAGVAYVVGDCVAYQEVVDAPTGVVLAGIKAVAPPAVDALDVGVCRAPGIGKAGVEQLGKLAAFFVRKAGVAAVGLGVLKVDLLVRHVKVAAGHDGFAGLALEQKFFRDLEIIMKPCVMQVFHMQLTRLLNWLLMELTEFIFIQ